MLSVISLWKFILFETMSPVMNVSETLVLLNTDFKNKSIRLNESAVILIPVNNFVVSMVTRIISEGFLFDMNNLEFVSVMSKVSVADLVLVATDDNLSIRFNVSSKNLPKIATLFANMLKVMESANSLFASNFLESVSAI